jgi:anti-anti-sigma factor
MTIIQLPSHFEVPFPAPLLAYRNGHRVVCVAGQHDAATVASLSSELAEAMTGNGDDVIVDLTGVAFMDSSTVAALLRARTFLAARGRTLHLQSPSACARRVLDLCGVAYDAAPTPAPELRVVPIEGPAR